MSGEAAEGEVDGRTLFLYDGETADLEFDIGVLKVDPTAEGDAEGYVEVILIFELEERALVAVPQAAWHRRAANRALPPGSFSKPVAVEVAGALREDRATVLREQRLKIWLGFLLPSLVERLDFDFEGERTVSFTTVGGESGYVPHAEALMELAKDKYQFATATENEAAPASSFTTVGGESGYVPHAEALMELAKDKYQFATATENEAAPASSAAPLPPRLSVEGRLTKLEATLGSLTSSLEVLTQQPGIEMDSLRQFSQLLATSPARRLKDPGGGVAMKASVLDESGDEAEAEAVQATSNENLAVASAPQHPVSAALVKLTAIVEDLQGQKRKRGTRLEQALDGAAGGSGSQEGSGISNRKNSMARRALRQALHEAPEEIYSTIEKLMLEDLLSRTLAPGMPKPALCARAWLENRSRLTNFPAAVRTAWGVAGILDCLINSNVAEARARAALMLLQADQASLELAPPFHAFANHVPPDSTDQPFTRLMEPRWGEIFLHHLRETEDYTERRRKLNAKGNRSQSEEEPNKEKPGPKPKPKPKAQGEGHA
eukprot:s5974_g6.t1